MEDSYRMNHWNPEGEQDSPGDNTVPLTTANKPNSQRPNQQAQIFSLKNDGELAVLEEIQQELIAQEQAILEEYDKSMQYEEQCVIAMAEGLDADSHVICPLCHRNNLTVNSHFVSCPCGMYINTLNKNITVEYLRSLLESRVTDHNYQCCQNPVFSVANGIERCANLLMSCMACDYLSVIL